MSEDTAQGLLFFNPRGVSWGLVSNHRSLKLTYTNRCPSGSSATLPPAVAPHPLFLCRPGACTLGKCKTSTKPARKRRPTPTASPGNIAPTSSTTSCVICGSKQQARRTRRSKSHFHLPPSTGTHYTQHKWRPQVNP